MPLKNFKRYIQHHTQLSDTHFNELTRNIRVEVVKKHTRLLNQGEVCRFSFFVSKGLLRLYTLDQQGKEFVIQFAPEDWIVGDRSSAYFNQASDYFIDCIEDSEIVFIDRQLIERASDIDKNFRTYFDNLLHNHIRHMQRRISFLLCATAEQRYMEFITLYPDLMLRAPQWMIASYLGITPESLSRVRKELANKHFRTI